MKIRKIVLVLSAAVLSLAVFTLFCMHKASPPAIKLPAPTGPFAVGTTEYHFIDKKRKDTESKNPEAFRELMVHIWYPSRDTKGEPYPYLAQVMPYLKTATFECENIPLEQLSNLDVPIKTHSMYNAPISNAQPQYPVLVFSHGLGMHVARTFTSILEDLASHGYIVVGIDHTYDNLVTIFPGGRAVRAQDSNRMPPEGVTDKDEIQEMFEEMLSKNMEKWVGDIQFVLNELEKINKNDPQNLLTSKFDLSRIGIFGHSFGGAAAAQMCRRDKRCKAGILIDGGLRGEGATIPFDKPFMFLLAEKSQDCVSIGDKAYVERYGQTSKALSYTLFNNLTNDAYRAIIAKANHGIFSDYPFLLPKLPDTIAPLRGIEITRALLLDFFDTYLKGEISHMKNIQKKYPEIALQSHTKKTL